MKELTIKNLNDFISQKPSINKLMGFNVFRGQSNNDWELKPKLFRDYKPLPILIHWKTLESELFNSFKKNGQLDFNSYDDLSILVTAQHYGLPTRLLDWTLNPIVALFFAVKDEEYYDKDGVVFSFSSSSKSNVSELEFHKIDKLQEYSIIHTKLNNKRIIKQEGVFTIHKLPYNYDNFIPLEKRNEDSFKLDKFIIPMEFKKGIKQELYEIGFDDFYIYPDLEGLSKRIVFEAFEWTNETKNKYYR